MPRPKKEKPNHGNLYEVKITIGRGVDGRLIRKSFYSSISKADAKKQAEQWKIDQAVAEQTGEVFVTRDITFARWAEKWLQAYKAGKVSENTYRLTYENTVYSHLIPYFGSAKVKDIRPVDLQTFFAGKLDYSDSMVKKMVMCLNGIFDSAVENGCCARSPMKSVNVSGRDAQQRRVYTDEQIARVKSLAWDAGRYDVIVLLETGMRRGELLGLRWDDVDFKAMTYSVCRSIATHKGGGVTVNLPKWNSFRTNPLTDEAAKALRMMPMECEYIFPTPSGEPQNPNTWSQKLKRFMKLVQESGCPALTAHELRHTYGTALRRRGVDIYTIQKVMGHRDIKVTSETYVHNEIEVLRSAITVVKGRVV